ncbi:hypothetical protein ACPOL_6775 (plasmid) [Acidisarcina polymorpha]|uniref:Uncharacterized protein n=1 Tax=Acidisarcina polymorpha TaxID=2211140 RepID=A0A2Z5GBH7_9BACT|nr:hypothetical protein ACPOL_6775 [Acidisarcina polymorpha]
MCEAHPLMSTTTAERLPRCFLTSEEAAKRMENRPRRIY